MKRLLFGLILICQGCTPVTGSLFVESATTSQYDIRKKKLKGANCSLYGNFKLKKESENITIQNISLREVCLDGYEQDTLIVTSHSINIRKKTAKIRLNYINKQGKKKKIKMNTTLKNDSLEVGKTVPF